MSAAERGRAVRRSFRKEDYNKLLRPVSATFPKSNISLLRSKFESVSDDDKVKKDEYLESKKEAEKVLNNITKQKLRRNVSLPVESTIIKPVLKKRVSFDDKPIPAPRKSLQLAPFELVKVEVKNVDKEKVIPVIIKADDTIVYANPEDRHIISRASSEDSLDKITNDLDQFIMEKSDKKKRSNSFKKIRGFFGKDKKKEKVIVENKVVNDNEANFNRNSVLRHTTDNTNKEVVNGNLEHRYAQMHINRYNQIKANFAQGIDPNKYSEDYVCMDNGLKKDATSYMNVPKYIDSSSSNNTLDSYHQGSENSSSSVEKPLNTINQNIRAKFFENNETPPRAFDTHQNVQLVKPKAIIPINSERPLPNPYQQSDLSDGVYGTIYERKLETPRSPSLEGSKLRLPANREKCDLQPRIKSPIPPSMVSTDKIIATELLKNKKDKLTSPSHQRLEIDIDYPDSKAKPPVSPINSQITTNVQVHVDSMRSMTPEIIQSRSITPVTIRSQSSTLSLQRTPPKQEIRQTVEAYCWKELKKLKEREDMELQMKIQLTPYGYNEDPVISHRSRSMSPTTSRNSRRSSSLPREVIRQRRMDDANIRQGQLRGQVVYNPNFIRMSPQRNTIDGQRPIFKRGSLTQQSILENRMTPEQQAIYNKKVSFHSPQNPENPQAWPTKNGFTQSPPQRRPEFKNLNSLEDDVFLPNEAIYGTRINPNVRMTPNSPPRMNANTDPRLNSNNDPRMNPHSDPRMNQNDISREPIYGTRTQANYGANDRSKLSPNYNTNGAIYSSKASTDGSIYGAEIVNGSKSPKLGSPNNVSREAIYGSKNSPNDAPMYSRKIDNQVNDATREAIYGSKTMPTNDGAIYGNKNFNPIEANREPIYGSKNLPTTVDGSIYGNKNFNEVNREAIYGATREPIYGSRTTVDSSREPIYGSRIQNIEATRQPIYGTRMNPNIDHQNIREPIYATRPNPNGDYYNQSIREPIYATKPNPNGYIREPIYGTKMDPYGNRSPNSNRISPNSNRISNSPNSSRMSPNGSIISEPQRPLTREEIFYINQQRKKQMESGYYARNRQMPNIRESTDYLQSRYDYPPDEYNQRIPPPYPRQTTMNTKHCDFYGKIHDNNQISSPPPQQRSGVLYGQLQRNSNAPPMQYQSYNQLQNQNFQRGSRLTASVNDMYRRYQPEPPNRPLPPIPNESKSKFLLRRKASMNEGDNEVQRIFQQNPIIGK